MGLARSQNGRQMNVEHIKQVVSIVEAFKADRSYHMMQYQIGRQRGETLILKKHLCLQNLSGQFLINLGLIDPPTL